MLVGRIIENAVRKGCEMEKPVRSLAKAISWRVVATLTTVLLVFVLGKDLTLASIVGVAELAIKTVVYYLHERVWNLSSLGRHRGST
jgi:uncharacterized membrane protein